MIPRTEYASYVPKDTYILADNNGIPLSVVVITAASTHDVKAAIKTLDSMVIKRRSTKNKKKQNLCLDRGYDAHEIECEVVKRRYIPQIRRRGEKKKKKHGERKRRRWVVERTFVA
jgi:putative transposase